MPQQIQFTPDEPTGRGINFTPDVAVSTVSFTPDEPVVEEEQGTLSKFIEWGTTPLLEKYPEISGMSPEERASLHPVVQSERTFAEYATAPFSLLGEALGGIGAIAGLRKLSRLGKLGKAAGKVDDIPTTRPGIIGQAGTRPTIFPESPLATPLQTELGSKLPPRDVIRNAIGKSEPLNVKQQEIYAKGIREKVARMQEVKATGVEGFRQETAALGGKYEKVEITPLKNFMSPEQLDDALIEIKAHPDLMPLESRNAREAMMKLYEGNVPQPSEIKLLRKVWGDEIVQDLIETAGKKTTVLGKVGDIAVGTQDLMRAILTSYDLSPVGRQGRLFMSYPEYWKAFPTMVKSWGKNFFKANQDAIIAHPNFARPRDAAGKVTGKSVSERGGLDLTNLTTNREEIFLSRVAQKIPGIPASNRAYIGFLNKLRSDMFNRLVKETGGDVLQNDIKLRAIGKLINNATGRGKLPGKLLEDNARLMNQIFFAPRLHAGKLRMYGQLFNPKFYTEVDPVVRKAALRSLITSTSFSIAVGSLFAQMGAEVSNDPTSSDYRKIKIGKTRIDPFGGDQQYAVVIARLMTGESTSSTSGRVTNIYDPGFGEQSAGGVLADFAANRLAPIPSMAVNLMFGRDYGKDPDLGILGAPGILPENKFTAELADKVVPIMVQDIWEITQKDPDMWPALVPGTFGWGVQTYGR